MIITQGKKAIAPNSWLYLKIDGLEYIDAEGIYDYNFSFVFYGDDIDSNNELSQSNSALNILPDYLININNSYGFNQLDSGESIISKNLLNIKYNANRNANDTIFAYNENGYLISFKKIRIDIPSKETLIDANIDLLNVNENATILFTVSDEGGNLVDGGNISIYIDGELLTILDIENGKGLLNISFENPGNYSILANYSCDGSFYLNSTFSSTISVYDESNLIVKHTGDDALDIQRAIDNANPGDTIQLGNYNYINVSNLNITKDISIISDGASVSCLDNSVAIFNIIPLSENGPSKVTVRGINFILSNGDIVVLLNAENSSNPLAIDVSELNFINNSVSLINDSIVAESINIVQLESERAILSPSNEININGNNIIAGINPFEFVVTSVTNGSSTNVPSGGNLDKKLATFIDYEDMVTVAVDTDTDGRIGDNFTITLKDSNGKALANKDVKFGFNGKIYNKTTDDEGKAILQINLKRADIYTFAVSFQGDDLYNGSFAVAKITVNKQKGNLAVPNKSYKVSVNTKSLTATFKSASGKLVANKKVSFTINGKTYTATTNAKGVASVNVSLNKKGTYNFTAKFAGDNTYAAITKTAKLTLN